MVPCATGSDGGGSIRIPAACCGLVGMKPTRGRVSLQPVGSAWLGLSTFGGLARTVKDSALLLDAMHGAIEGDTYSAPPPEGRYVDAAARPPGRLRIAVSRKLPPGLMARLSGDQRRAWEETATLLRDLGHEVSERDPAYGTGGLLFTQTWVRGVYDESKEVPDHSVFERATRGMIAAGRLVSDSRAGRLKGELRERTTKRILALWDDVDVLMTPGLATTAIEAEGGYGKSAIAAFNTAARFTPWTAAFNVTGQPAVAIPAGTGSDGLPLSVQLVGAIGAEDVLYSLAAQIEEARPWADRRPSLALPSVSP
jgi:amidase